MFAAIARTVAAAAAATTIVALAAACSPDQAATTKSTAGNVTVDPYLGEVSLGSASATVTVTEFHSMSCSHCRDFWKQDFPRLKAEYIDTGKVKWVWKDFPTDPDIAVAGIAIARCKGGAEAYHQVADEFFSKQFDIFEAARTGAAGGIIVGIAQKFGVSPEEARACTDSKAIRDAIQADVTLADKMAKDAGLPRTPGTPAIYVGTEYQNDYRYPALSAKLNEKLGGPAAPAAPATPATAPATPPSGGQ